MTKTLNEKLKLSIADFAPSSVASNATNATACSNELTGAQGGRNSTERQPFHSVNAEGWA